MSEAVYEVAAKIAGEWAFISATLKLNALGLPAKFTAKQLEKLINSGQFEEFRVKTVRDAEL